MLLKKLRQIVLLRRKLRQIVLLLRKQKLRDSKNSDWKRKKKREMKKKP